MFDVSIGHRATETFDVELPDLCDDWQIGLVVGPSGSGKTSVASAAFGDAMVRETNWPEDRAVIDGFGDLPVRETARLLTAVGFGSPPAWIKPYQVLSNGERFRCDLARALAAGCSVDEGKESPLVVFDEFTSVVDRQVAKFASAAVARAIRRGMVRCRFVAVTCHYDVAEWLAPDWILDMASGRLARSCLRRPRLEIEIARCRFAAWRLFARHHYLSGQLSPTARCFLASWNDTPVAFAATIPLIGRKRRWRITRLVTLSDFQGLGIGSKLAQAVAELHREEGHRMSITTSHPGFIAHAQQAPHWRCTRLLPHGTRRHRSDPRKYCGSGGRASVSFEYVP